MGQFIKFCIVGLSNTLIGYLVYSLCVWLGMHYLIANFIGFAVSVTNAFYWSNRYVFRKEKDERRNPWTAFLKTIVAYAFTGLLLNSMLLWLLIDVGGISEYVAPLLILCITVPTNFLMNKYWSFKTKQISNEKDQHTHPLLQ